MEQLAQFDLYSIGATLCTAILGVILPVLAHKYQKLINVLKKCRKLISTTLKACEDSKVTKEELEEILIQLDAIIKVLKK